MWNEVFSCLDTFGDDANHCAVKEGYKLLSPANLTVVVCAERT
jgi:hypothetical protein